MVKPHAASPKAVDKLVRGHPGDDAKLSRQPWGWHRLVLNSKTTPSPSDREGLAPHHLRLVNSVETPPIGFDGSLAALMDHSRRDRTYFLESIWDFCTLGTGTETTCGDFLRSADHHVYFRCSACECHPGPSRVLFARVTRPGPSRQSGQSSEETWIPSCPQDDAEHQGRHSHGGPGERLFWFRPTTLEHAGNREVVRISFLRCS